MQWEEPAAVVEWKHRLAMLQPYGGIPQTVTIAYPFVHLQHPLKDVNQPKGLVAKETAANLLTEWFDDWKAI